MSEPITTYMKSGSRAANLGIFYLGLPISAMMLLWLFCSLLGLVAAVVSSISKGIVSSLFDCQAGSLPPFHFSKTPCGEPIEGSTRGIIWGNLGQISPGPPQSLSISHSTKNLS